MSKILIELYVPSIEKQYSFRIPNNILINELVPILSTMIKENSPEYFEDSKAVICDQDTGIQYDSNRYVGDSGMVNGSRVLLI